MDSHGLKCLYCKTSLLEAFVKPLKALEAPKTSLASLINSRGRQIDQRVFNLNSTRRVCLHVLSLFCADLYIFPTTLLFAPVQVDTELGQIQPFS